MWAERKRNITVLASYIRIYSFCGEKTTDEEERKKEKIEFSSLCLKNLFVFRALELSW